MPHSFLEYARLKAIVSTFRLSMKLVTWNNATAHPDDLYSFKSRDGKRDIKVHVYRPKSTTEPSPVVLNWHGSGFVLPAHGADTLFCRRIADGTPYTVLDASYAVAPEDPFPAALEDVEDLILEVLKQPDQYDSQNVVLSGFSAGANLALAASSNSGSDIPKDSIRAIIAFYPACDLSFPPAQKKAPDGSSGTIPAALANVFNDSYMPPGVDRADPRIAVLHADPESFPSDVLMFTCSKDNLAGEAEELADKLKAAGKKVTLRRVEDAEHGWDKTTDENSNDAKERDAAYDLAISFLSALK
jgi:acetyl esterase/lipase